MFGFADPLVKHFNLPAAAHLIPMHQYHTLLTILGLLETVIFITDFSFQKCFILSFQHQYVLMLACTLIYWYTLTYALSQASLTLIFPWSQLSSRYATRPIPKHTWPLCLSHTHPITLIWLLVQDLSLFSVLMQSPPHCPCLLLLGLCIESLSLINLDVIQQALRRLWSFQKKAGD